MSCDECKQLLSDGLDLCVRAQAMDAQDRTAAQMSSHSMTLPLWVQDQYDKDLAEWERSARHHLMQGCAASTKEPKE